MEEKYYEIPSIGYVKIKKLKSLLGKYFVLNNHLAKRYAGYRLISKDVELILEAITVLKTISRDQLIIKQSLTFFIAINYGKCFVSAQGRGVKLEKKDIDGSWTPQENDLHDELINMRHQYIAHSGKSKFETNPVVLAMFPTESNYSLMIYDSLKYMSSLRLNSSALEQLVTKISRIIDIKLDEAYDKLRENTFLSFDETDFDKKAFTPDIQRLVRMEDIIS